MHWLIKIMYKQLFDVNCYFKQLCKWPQESKYKMIYKLYLKFKNYLDKQYYNISAKSKLK